MRYTLRMILLLTCLTAVFGRQELYAQGETNIWYFGRNAGINYNPATPTPLFDGALLTNEGCATLCRPDGTLMMYTDGIRVWNRNHVVMPNGNGLRGDPSSTQSGIIVPRPGSNDIFYIFTVDMQAGQALFAGGDADGIASGVRYTEVNMAANGGLGAVNAAVKNVPLLGVSTEGLSAVKHANGVDYWVVAHGWNNNQYRAWAVTSAGVNATPVISNSGPVVNGGPDGIGAIGYMKISPNGRKIAAAHGYGLRSVVLSDFNDATGVVSNSINMSVATNSNSDGPYGVEFSQCNEYLYVSEQFTNFGFYYDSPRETRIYRYDLAAANIPGSRTTFATINFEWVGALQLASDGNIYCASIRRQYDSFYAEYYGTFNRYIHRINNPRSPVATFTLNAIDLNPRTSAFGLPPFLTSYFNDLDFSAVSNISSDTIFCIGDSTLFNAQVVFYDSIRWYFGDPASGASNNTATTLNPKHFYSAPGTYDILLIKYLCNKADTVFKTVNIRPRPEFDIPDTIGCQGIPISFTAPISGGSYYLWSNGSNSTTTTISTPGVQSLLITVNSCSNADVFNITINPLPPATISPSGPTSFCQPGSVTLNAPPGMVSYQWLLNGNPIPGANTSSYTATASGNYSILLKDANCENTSAATTVTVDPIPTLSITPVGPLSICAGENALLTLNPANLSNIRWFLDGNLISGANAATYTATQAGNYSVLAQSAAGCEGSSNTVNITVNPLPNLQISPAGPINICTGDNTTLTLSPSGLQNIVWSRDGNTIGGQTSQTLDVTQDGSYTATAENSAGCPGSSNAVQVNVLNQFTIDMTASATGFCPGENVLLTINTPGVLNIQWLLNGQPISGANGNTYTATTGGDYTVTGENANGCPGTSNPVSITAHPSPNVAITPTGSNTICAGDDIVLTLTTPGLQNVQWNLDGSPISGQTSSTYTATQAGNYTVTAESANGCPATSNTTEVIVSPLPNLQISPAGPINICTGDNTTLTLSPSGLQNIVWSRDGNTIGGQTSQTLDVTQDGSYTATAENSAGCPGSSNAVQVNVLNQFTIDMTASATGFCPGENVLLTINTPGVLNIQWLLNGQPISGANGNTYTATTGGDYTVTGENANGCPGTSNPVSITAHPSPNVAITPTGSNTICAGDDIVLTLTTPGLQNVQWNLDGSPISGQTSSTYTATQAGNYTVTAESANGCPATSNTTEVIVSPLPNLQISPAGPINICTGDNTTLTLSPSGLQNIVWSRDGNTIGGQTSQTLDVTQDGSYTATAENSAGCPGSSNAVQVNVLNQFTIDMTASATGFCPGENVLLTINTPGVLNIQWLLNGQPISGANGNTYTATTGGDYTVTGENANGCPGTSNPVSITAHPSPNVAITPTGSNTICAGDDIVLTLTTPGLQNVQWNLDGSPISGQTSSTYTATQAGNYTVTAESANGCPATSNTTEVIVSPLPNLQISPAGPINICTGDNTTLTLSPSGLQNIIWSRDGNVIGGQTSQTLDVTQAGSYTATAENSAGCPGSSNAVQVQVNNTFTIILDPVGPVSICEGQSSTITIQNPGLTNIQWFRNGTLVAGAVSNSLNVNTSGNYSVTATGSTGCQGTSSPVSVTFNPLPVVSIASSGPLNFCDGQSVDLSADVTSATAGSYTWQLNGNDISSSSQITATQSGTYTLNVISDEGCPGNIPSVQVNVNPYPMVDLGDDVEVCAGIPVILDATTSGASYSWSNGATSSTISPTQSGNYSVSVTLNGCSGFDTVQVTLFPAPVVNLGADVSICDGEVVTLDLSNVAADSYQWNTGETTPSIQITDPGIYSVLVVANNCSTSDTMEVILKADPPVVSLGNDTSFCKGTPFTLIPSGSDIVAYLWQDGSSAATYSVTATGLYTVKVSGECGEDSASVSITIEDCGCLVSVPNAFTPNGDGINDRLLPLYNCPIENVYLAVFNRWGEKVFETNTLGVGWNGVYKNELQPTDAYVYYVSYFDVTLGKSVELKGTALLLK
jgi:large repetitive protein